MTTATTSTASAVPDDVVGVVMSRDGSGTLHCLAPCASKFMWIDVETRPDGSIHVAFFRPHSCGIAAGDPVQVMPEPRGPN